jgi:hypothetical protein
MKTNRATLSLILASSLLLLVSVITPLGRTGLAPAAAESVFPVGAVVGLQGTPHLWIADEVGVLHWGGDTRALRNRFVDWSARVEVSLDTLKTLTRGDPYLTAGLLKDGDPIYLVKWETEEAVPRLFHIPCIADVELFGIKTENYLTFVIDRPVWETRQWEGLVLQAGSLQKLPLTPADPTAPRCAGATGTAGPATPTSLPTATPIPSRPEIRLSASEVASCAPALQRFGFAVSEVNVERTVTVALPPSVTNQPQAILEQVAPLTRASSQTATDLAGNLSGAPIGVMKLGRTVQVDPATLTPGMYVVVTRGGTPSRMVFVPCSPNPTDIVTSAQPDVRTIASRNVIPPQAIAINNAACFSWNRVQVCTPPSPLAGMTASEQSAMNQAMGNAVSRLSAAGRMSVSEVNSSVILPDVEGTNAVQTMRGSILASPPTSWPGTAANNAVAGVIHAEMDVDIPGMTRVPAGDYVVRVSGSTTGGWIARLIAVDGTQHQVPVAALEVLGAPMTPDVAVVNLAFILSAEVQLCFFGEC